MRFQGINYKFYRKKNTIYNKVDYKSICQVNIKCENLHLRKRNITD